MKSLKVILAVVIMSLGVSHLLGAQELNCSVEINTDKISGTDKMFLPPCRQPLPNI